MARQETSLRPLFSLAKIGGIVYVAAAGIAGVGSAIVNTDQTDTLENKVTVLLAERPTIVAEADKCFYRSGEEMQKVVFEEWPGYRVFNTAAWFFGLSEEIIRHDLGTLPVYIYGPCAEIDERYKLTITEYVNARAADAERFVSSAQYKAALHAVNDEGKLAIETVPALQPR